MADSKVVQGSGEHLTSLLGTSESNGMDENFYEVRLQVDRALVQVEEEIERGRSRIASVEVRIDNERARMRHVKEARSVQNRGYEW